MTQLMLSLLNQKKLGDIKIKNNKFLIKGSKNRNTINETEEVNIKAKYLHYARKVGTKDKLKVLVETFDNVFDRQIQAQAASGYKGNVFNKWQQLTYYSAIKDASGIPFTLLKTASSTIILPFSVLFTGFHPKN